MTGNSMHGRRSFGVIGGLGPLASADVFFKLVSRHRQPAMRITSTSYIEQHPFRGAGATSTATTERKLYIFDLIRAFEKRGIDTVVLPCFLSHTFMAGSRRIRLCGSWICRSTSSHVRRKFPSARRIGVLASDYTRQHGLFERYFSAPESEVVHPRIDPTTDLVTRAVKWRRWHQIRSLAGAGRALLRAA